MKIWRFSFVIINVLRCSVDYVWTFNDLVWRKICGISCFSEINLWVSMFEDFFSEENVTHELIHFGEWKMCVNMFEYFLLPIIVLCEVMHFRERKIYYQLEESVLKTNVMFVLKHLDIWKCEWTNLRGSFWKRKFQWYIFEKKVMKEKERYGEQWTHLNIFFCDQCVNVWRFKECANMFNDCNWFHLSN